MHLQESIYKNNGITIKKEEKTDNETEGKNDPDGESFYCCTTPYIDKFYNHGQYSGDCIMLNFKT